MLITHPEEVGDGLLWAGVVVSTLICDTGTVRIPESGVWAAMRKERVEGDCRGWCCGAWVKVSTGQEWSGMSATRSLSLARLPDSRFLRWLATFERQRRLSPNAMRQVIRFHYWLRPRAWRRAVGLAEMVTQSFQGDGWIKPTPIANITRRFGGRVTSGTG
jgi:hypothetical protein